MNFKTFLTSLALAATAFAPMTYAQYPTPPVTPVVSATTEIAVVAPAPVPLTPEQVMQAELADLRIKESDPATGSFAKFFIRLKIRQLENQLNLKKAFE